MELNKKEEGLLAIGTTLANGKYKIEKYLASGGFGKTYVATDTAFDEKVAIKELYIKGVCGRMQDSCEVSVSLTENQRTFTAQQEKFRKEARRLRKLTNSHIVRVHDLFDENGTSYYVMDFVEGESLSSRLKGRKKPMSEADVMLILPQILDALECVHAEGIWHLDLKPANIMLDKRGNAQLIDFGASKQLRNSDGDSLSTSSALAYTQGYAPSEQMEQNIDKFGPWTDIYALGATLYYLLTMNQLPTPSDIDEDVDEALPFGSNISKKTKELIIWMMKPNRKMRPQSIADIKQFLLEGGSVSSNEKTHQASSLSSDDTVIKSSTRTSQTKGNTTEKAPKDNATTTKNKMILYGGIASVLIVVVGIIVGMVNMSKDSDNIADIDSTAVDSTQIEVAIPIETYVTERMINLKSFDELNLGEDKFKMYNYTYTGEVNEAGIPNGSGKAVFADGRKYEGEFVDGLCEGKGIFTLQNGDKFEGKMSKNQFVNGKYTFTDGSFFNGTFKDGQPDEGEWSE